MRLDGGQSTECVCVRAHDDFDRIPSTNQCIFDIVSVSVCVIVCSVYAIKFIRHFRINQTRKTPSIQDQFFEAIRSRKKISRQSG